MKDEDIDIQLNTLHVEYGEYKVVINLNDEVVQRFMPKRALRLVFEWMDIHKNELLENWKLARSGEIIKKIEPLK